MKLLWIALFVLVGSVVADECASLNFCSSHGQCIDGKCVCHAGWGSEDCSLTTTGCPSFCSAHGSCLNGTCVCDNGFVGDACNVVKQSCPNNCTGHGTCANGQCACYPGIWTGAACDEEIYNCPTHLNNCTGHGECVPSDPLDSAAEWLCQCDNGFCGAACDAVCGTCSNNCTGHGICSNGLCECEPGFSGIDCSYVAPVASCPNNCSGNGSCKKINGTFSCVCQGCYSGDACDVSTVFCPGGCSGRGICDCGGTCHCQPGFTGVACQEEIATCDHLNFCSANGKCANGTCKCEPGFAGKKCNLACHTGGSGTVGCNADRGHGVCVEVSNSNSTAQCMCKPEFEGIGCEKETTENLLDDYINGWNPIGTVVLGIVGASIIAFMGGFVYNYSKGMRGVNAVPGLQSVRSKVKGVDYEQSIVEGNQRNVSNY